MTKVFGNISTPEGYPYEGALIKFNLRTALTADGLWFGTPETRTFSNSFGRFEVTIPDTTGEDFYYLTVVYDKAITRLVTVPKSDIPINFIKLPEYLFPYERIDELGGDC